MLNRMCVLIITPGTTVFSLLFSKTRQKWQLLCIRRPVMCAILSSFRPFMSILHKNPTCDCEDATASVEAEAECGSRGSDWLLRAGRPSSSEVTRWASTARWTTNECLRKTFVAIYWRKDNLFFLHFGFLNGFSSRLYERLRPKGQFDESSKIKRIWDQMRDG